MRGDDAPTLGKAHPALALSPDAAVAQELGVGGGEVVAVGGDDRLAQLACQVERRAAGAEGGDRGVAVGILTEAVAQRQRRAPEQGVEHGDVVADQRRFVAPEGGLDLGDDLLLVDLDHRAANPSFSRTRATRSASASRHGAAMTWTPNGSIPARCTG